MVGPAARSRRLHCRGRIRVSEVKSYNGGRVHEDQMCENETTIDPKGHATDLFTQWAMDTLKDRAKKAPAKTPEPFFMLLSYNAPHAPIQPPKDWLKKVTDRNPKLPLKRSKIVALIEHLDDGIGQVLTSLNSLGLKDNTIVVFTSDNGGKLHYGASNGALRSDKTHVYEGGIKVPTCIVWRGHVQANTTTEFEALTMDILPTLAEMCNISIPHEVDGDSFKQLAMTGKQTEFDRAVFHMWLQKTTRESIRHGDWKLVRDQQERPYELYNIKDDLSEKTNLATIMPEKVGEMARVLQAHMARAKAVQWQRKTGPKDE